MVRFKLPGGQADRRPVPRPRRHCRPARQRHACASPPGRASSSTASSRTNLKATIAGINDALVTTLGGLRRREPQRHGLPRPARTTRSASRCNELADAIAAHLAPQAGTKAYHEIWLNGEKGGTPTATRPSRADLRQGLPAAEVQDRLRRCRTTTASTVWPTASASWPSSRTASPSATTCSSAAAWA